MKQIDELKMKQLFASIGGNWEEFSKTAMCKGIMDNRASISMTDFEKPSKDKVQYFDDDDSCFDEFRNIIYYWHTAAEKDKSYSVEFPKGEYYFENGQKMFDPGNYILVYRNDKQIRMYVMSLSE